MQLNDHGLYDIYEMYHVPFWQTSCFFWCIIIVFGCLVVLFFVFLLNLLLRRKQKTTPWSKALKQLEAIDAQIALGSLSSEEIKGCYFVITATLKRYMAERHYCPASEHLTDSEFVQSIEPSGVADEIKQVIKTLYDNIMKIKFADKKTVISNLKNDMAQVRAIIYATIPDKKRLV